MKLFILWCLAAGFSAQAQAKLNIVTTTTDLAYLASAVGGERVSVESIAKGSQDPHFIEAKPSYMVKINRADLVLAVGLDLEVGWLPSLLQGARNPKVNVGSEGYFEVGPTVRPLELPTGKITRAEGDVHPLGNPHVTLDPLRAGEIAVAIAGRLARLDPTHAQEFAARAKALQSRLNEKTALWQARIAKSGVKKVVSYHRTLTYFFARFGLENTAILEPKPGIPPTSGHIIEVVRLMKEQKVGLILVENYFDASVTKKILAEVPSARAATVPVSVGGESKVESLEDLYESLVKAVEGK